MKPLAFLFISLSCSLLVACQLFRPTPPLDPPDAQPIEVQSGTAEFDYWRHAPLHPANRQAVRFNLKAFDGFGIRKVELYVHEFELYRDADGLPSKRRRPGGQWGLLNTWKTGAGQDSIQLSHSYANGFPARSNVEYIFQNNQ